jgi:hypothetical protein
LCDGKKNYAVNKVDLVTKALIVEVVEEERERRRVPAVGEVRRMAQEMKNKDKEKGCLLLLLVLVSFFSSS